MIKNRPLTRYELGPPSGVKVRFKRKDRIEFDLQGELYNAVKADYDLVRQTLFNPQKGFGSLTGKMGLYIQPRTKGAGHGTTSRAFYARPRFLEKFIKL
ncbi:MAG: hypothetical protein Q8N90_01450 [bacterium]|nr:hypothetical protein [bacterium]